MRTASTRVRTEVHEGFRNICKEQGATPHAVLKEFLLAYVAYFGGGG